MRLTLQLLCGFHLLVCFKIYIREMNEDDEIFILSKAFELPMEMMNAMVSVKKALVRKMLEDADFCARGRPFEFNLRDLLRWGQLTSEVKILLCYFIFLM